MVECIVASTLRQVLGDLPEPQKDLVITRMSDFMRAMPQNMGNDLSMPGITGVRTDGHAGPGVKLTYNLRDLAAYVRYGFK